MGNFPLGRIVGKSDILRYIVPGEEVGQPIHPERLRGKSQDRSPETGMSQSLRAVVSLPSSATGRPLILHPLSVVHGTSRPAIHSVLAETARYLCPCLCIPLCREGVPQHGPSLLDRPTCLRAAQCQHGNIVVLAEGLRRRSNRLRIAARNRHRAVALARCKGCLAVERYRDMRNRSSEQDPVETRGRLASGESSSQS